MNDSGGGFGLGGTAVFIYVDGWGLTLGAMLISTMVIAEVPGLARVGDIKRSV